MRGAVRCGQYQKRVGRTANQERIPAPEEKEEPNGQATSNIIKSLNWILTLGRSDIVHVQDETASLIRELSNLSVIFGMSYGN